MNAVDILRNGHQTEVTAVANLPEEQRIALSQKDFLAKQNRLKLMCILAHPDDESLGTGGILAKYAAEGVHTSVITATRGQQGWPGDPAANPGPEALGQLRAGELRAAADVLGVQELILLDYMDGELDEVDWETAVSQIAHYIRLLQPHVVVTFDPYGAYGHPDHIAISQMTMAAIVAASSSNGAQPPHQVAKLYYMADTAEIAHLYEDIFGELVMTIDDEERRMVSWPRWAITTRIETAAYLPQIWQAISCHRSQLPGYNMLVQLPLEQRHRLYGQQSFYRAFSLVNGGRTVENDLFDGLRENETHLQGAKDGIVGD
ncbi:PIG-L deacetylase family protein [Candidatus Leptofilum sp.]|uniref:PIG-L deacetylase family protein n=1 Tax=Candidatus Leptofilum sp. TaxID=3241576 RepID=UPI003B5AF60D